MAELIRRRANAAAVKVHSAPARLMHNHIFTVATPTGVYARTQRVRAHMPPATTAVLIKYLHASTHTSNRREADQTEIRRHRPIPGPDVYRSSEEINRKVGIYGRAFVVRAYWEIGVVIREKEG